MERAAKSKPREGCCRKCQLRRLKEKRLELVFQTRRQSVLQTKRLAFPFGALTCYTGQKNLLTVGDI